MHRLKTRLPELLHPPLSHVYTNELSFPSTSILREHKQRLVQKRDQHHQHHLPEPSVPTSRDRDVLHPNKHNPLPKKKRSGTLRLRRVPTVTRVPGLSKVEHLEFRNLRSIDLKLPNVCQPDGEVWQPQPVAAAITATPRNLCEEATGSDSRYPFSISLPSHEPLDVAPASSACSASCLLQDTKAILPEPSSLLTPDSTYN
ncbi:hypothetical protein EYF80_047419 [Liparis tanakae]|uniref:Uncharacterized protein n=1 Tax=Liparis tanakae TaxID=230148 RepID=A0A4Z2FMD2_9TELE|nr:hypothetical protein EYF80_047419 [Liparis tanakae]